MKILLGLLIAANLILFGVMKSGVLDDGQANQVVLPLNEQKITLLDMSKSAEEGKLESLVPASGVVAVPPVEVAASAPLVAAPQVAKAETMSCFEWGEFSGTELDRVHAMLKKLQLGDKMTQRDTAPAIGYWVYIPPLNNKAEVNQKVVQLKALGVTEYFVVQDPGEWFNAISLGVFKTRESAQNHLDGLRAQKVISAQLGERAGKVKSTTFVFTGLNAVTSQKLADLQKNFPVNTLKNTTCH